MTLRELWLRLTYPLRQRQLDRELRDEIELHVSLRAAQLERFGVSAPDAVDAARKRFGNQSRITSASRDAWGWHWLDGLRQDLRYVVRQLRRSPAFALVTSLTIAIGIAVNATAFTFYNAVVLKPLPVADAARMVRITRDARGFGSEVLPYTAYDVLRRNARGLHSVVASTGPESFAAVLPGHAVDDSRVVSARFVSPDFARVLGVRTQIGRWFDATDDLVIVLDHDFWSRALDADPTVLGQRVRVGEVDLTVIGVAPRAFAGTGMPAVAPNFWIPLSALPAVLPNADWRNDGRAHWQLIGRLAPGASLATVNAELAVLGTLIPDSAGKPVPVTAKHATFFQTDAGEFEVFQQVSAAFMVALALILGIAMINLVNLFAARNAAREREVTVRLALGAGRERIARQLASESVLLALLGGALGLIASRAVASWLRTWIHGTMASISGGIVDVFLDITADWRVISYTALLSIMIGLAVGVWPALRAARGDVTAILRQGGTSTVAAAAWRKRNVLLAMQVAGSLVLLTAAGMLLGGIRLARHIDPGFDSDHMLVVDVEDNAPKSERASRRAEIARRLSSLADVRAVTWTMRVPFAGTYLRRANTASGPITISMDNVSESYFDAMAMPLLRGRTFSRQEVATNAPVMVISESMERVRWPTGDVVGKSVPVNDVLSGPDTTSSYTVIGVVRDVRSQFLSRSNGPSAYYPYGFDQGRGAFLVRTRGVPAATINEVRVAVGEVSPLLLNRTHVVTMQEGPMALQRLMVKMPATVALGLAFAGLVLASIGVYGLISTIVTQRSREIGVHMAIGARRHQVIWLVARKTLRPVAWGAGLGGLGALGLSLLLHSLIAAPDVPDLTFGAGAFNPVVFLGVLGVLAGVVAAACLVPARRAAAIDPTIALRGE